MRPSSRSEEPVKRRHGGGSGILASDEGQSSDTTRQNKQAPPLEFVIIHQPMLPPDQQHRKAVRRHVMRSFHSRRRAKNNPPARQHKLLQKATPGDLSQSRGEEIVSQASSVLKVDANDTGDQEIHSRPTRSRIGEGRSANYGGQQALQRVTMSNAVTSYSSSSLPYIGTYDSFDRWAFQTSKSILHSIPHCHCSNNSSNSPQRLPTPYFKCMELLYYA